MFGPTVYPVEGCRDPSVFWQLKAAANLSLFGRSNTNKGILDVNSLILWKFVDISYVSCISG